MFEETSRRFGTAVRTLAGAIGPPHREKRSPTPGALSVTPLQGPMAAPQISRWLNRWVHRTRRGGKRLNRMEKKGDRPQRRHKEDTKKTIAVRRLQRKRRQRAAPVNGMLIAPNQEWALDFVSDGVASGRGIRMLTVMDGFTRECPAIEVGVSLGSRRVTRVLERIIAERGAPQSLRCDNGPEFTSRHLLAWCEQRGIVLCTFNRASRCRTAIWKASMAGCAMNA
jgi:putative transposase